ncbi:hypothetical protein [Gordonia rubripertincta]|uniref:hypothetical protein n=1 Tax=Gordonia rubripertincta TaxID=36822 RepID=UPI000B8D31A6|nr:hypothetical protein [Gordonia rubripertincta]ASR05608.1 hypothetical protein GCWB2_24185 [Gordonia rubripertincta]
MSATRGRDSAATGVAAWLLTAWLLVAGAGMSWAVPSASDPAPPPSSGAPTSDLDPAAPSDGSSGDEIKAGTPKEGKIHWEEFGGYDPDASMDPDKSIVPETLEEFSDLIIGYALTGFGIAAVASGLVGFGAMVIGFRGRSQVAKVALEQSVWVYLACLIVGSFSTLGGALIQAAL